MSAVSSQLITSPHLQNATASGLSGPLAICFFAPGTPGRDRRRSRQSQLAKASSPSRWASSEAPSDGCRNPAEYLTVLARVDGGPDARLGRVGQSRPRFNEASQVAVGQQGNGKRRRFFSRALVFVLRGACVQLTHNPFVLPRIRGGHTSQRSGISNDCTKARHTVAVTR